MKRWLHLILCALAIPCLQGCFPSFDHPVVDLSAEARDERLLGLWEADPEYFQDMEKGDYGFLLILPCEAGYCLTLYTVEKGRGDAIHLIGYAQVINGTGYLNFQFYEVDPQESGHHLARYQLLADQSLVLTLIDPAKLEKAIADGTLKGEVEQKPDGFWSVKKIHVRSDREELLQALGQIDVFDSQPFGVFRYKADGIVRSVRNAVNAAPAAPSQE